MQKELLFGYRIKINIQIKKGDISIMQKQSNNILPKLRQLAEGAIGENFFFNGCMRYLMECIGREDISDFWISAYVTGDAYLFYYTPDQKRGMELCLTDLLFSDGDADYAKHIFDIYGYECTYIMREQISTNRQLFADMVKNYIDRGIPVIAVGHYPDLYGMCFPICGYQENGKKLLMLGQMSAEPFTLEFEKTSFDIIFIGNKKRDVTVDELYKRAITQMPQIYNIKRPDYAFGHEGFYRWADDIESLDANKIIRGYTDYIVNLATNVSGNKFGIDLPNNQNCGECEPYIKDISKIISGMCQKYHELNDIGGSFNISLETLQNPEKRKQIADKIREIGRIQEHIVEVFDKYDDVLKN